MDEAEKGFLRRFGLELSVIGLVLTAVLVYFLPDLLGMRRSVGSLTPEAAFGQAKLDFEHGRYRDYLGRYVEESHKMLVAYALWVAELRVKPGTQGRLQEILKRHGVTAAPQRGRWRWSRDDATDRLAGVSNLEAMFVELAEFVGTKDWPWSWRAVATGELTGLRLQDDEAWGYGALEERGRKWQIKFRQREGWWYLKAPHTF